MSSLQGRSTPAWYDEAKLGVMIHWGPYSVPGWAPRAGRVWDQPDQFRNNPYAEWYRNSMKIYGSPTAEHHGQVYGHMFAYEEFGARFNARLDEWDPDAWADLFLRSGARYVVPTSKHHDGFLLWPSRHTNPHAPVDYCARRDVVGELARAVRRRGMRFGVYYSGGLDWLWNDTAIRSFADLAAAIPRDPAYAGYAYGHWAELIERYRPDVLWNDIAMPGGLDRIHRLFSDYWDRVPEGVVNDRWRMKIDAAGRRQVLTYHDFTTSEYESTDALPAKKWEAVRGLGFSFGYNRDEGEDDYLSGGALVALLIETVAKGGNLLINAGPTAGGAIPALQSERLLALGAWLSENGEGIYGSRPWDRQGGTTREGRRCWFTAGGESLYVHLPAAVGGESVSLPDLLIHADAVVEGPARVALANEAGAGLSVRLPERLPNTPAVTLRVRPIPHLAPD